MNFDRHYHNSIYEARKLVSQFRQRLGERPGVEGLCPNKDSCDICREARKASNLYIAHLYAGWDIDAIIRLCEIYSDSESRIFGKDENTRLKSLYESFDEDLEKIRQKVNKSLKEYQYLLEDDNFFKDCKIAVKGLLKDVEGLCKVNLLSTDTVETDQTIKACRALIVCNNFDIACKTILKALIQHFKYLMEDGTLSKEWYPNVDIRFSQDIIDKYDELIKFRKTEG
jgi:hypothetical protein